MARQASEWWYALLGANPRTEAEELVNVGIITGNGRPVHVEHIPGLPRLSTLVSESQREAYEDLVSAVGARVASGTDLATLRVIVGPQLVIGQPRRLLREPDDAIIALLRRRFLDLPKDRFVRELSAVMNRSEREIDSVIQKHVPAVGIQFHRRAVFGRLYPELRDAPKVPPIARAIRGDRRDILVDGVYIEEGRAKDAVRAAATRIGRAFWYYRKLRDQVRTVIGHDLQTIGVVSFSAETAVSDEVLEARDYISHVWRQDADLVVDASQPESAIELGERMAWLVAPGPR